MTRESAIDLSDGICAYLMGGLGNQLFIVAAAWAQARRLDVPLYVDRSRLISRDPLEKPETDHGYFLDRYRLPGRVIGAESPWFANSPRRPVAIRRPGRRSGGLTVHRERGSGFDESISRIRPGTTVFGYFQSPEYFRSIEDDVLEMLTSLEPDEPERLWLEALRAEPLVTVHVRRGDYLSPAARRHHGLAEPDYFRRAHALIDRLDGWPGGRVFSDSPAIALDELSGIPSLVAAGDEAMAPPVALAGMAAGRGIVMSNSSFSWWAAWQISRAHAGAVVAPRPWTGDGSAAAQLLEPSWLTLGSR